MRTASDWHPPSPSPSPAAAPSRHHELRLHVGFDVGLPHRVLEVQVEGAVARHAAVAVAAPRLAVGQPGVGGARVSPRLPSQALLLHQQLQLLHLAARGPVLRLPQPVAWGTGVGGGGDGKAVR